MNEYYFNDRLREIYATFGKNCPNEAVRKAIFRRVWKLPDYFMDFALRKLEDEIALPANLGRHLYREIWPDYLDKRPELRKRVYQAGCARCGGNPGLRTYYEPDDTPHTCRCVCNTDPKTARQWTPTDIELMELGFLLENPKAPDLAEVRYAMPESLRKSLGLVEPMRREHGECLMELEAF